MSRNSMMKQHLTSNDDGIFVTWIDPNSAIGRDGRLKPGNRLLEVNEHWMMGLTLNEALKVREQFALFFIYNYTCSN